MERRCGNIVAHDHACRIALTDFSSNIDRHQFIAWTDGHGVDQILENLLGNPIRHTPPHSTVGLSVSKGSGCLQVVVTDEGPGIPEAHREHVFDVYYTKVGEEEHGVGLGLPLSRRLARLLGGDLTAADRPEGGAVFTLILPLPSAPEHG